GRDSCPCRAVSSGLNRIFPREPVRGSVTFPRAPLPVVVIRRNFYGETGTDHPRFNLKLWRSCLRVRLLLSPSECCSQCSGTCDASLILFEELHEGRASLRQQRLQFIPVSLPSREPFSNVTCQFGARALRGSLGQPAPERNLHRADLPRS